MPKTEDWEKDVDWADVIVFDDTLGQGEKAVALRARGKAVVGGTPYTDRLEDDRSFGQEELKKAGVTIIPYRDFDNFDEAISYVQENPSRYVIKPSGAAGNVKRRLFVGDEEDGGDVVRMLEAYKKAFSDEIKVFQLQKRVVGVEVAVGAFFNGKSFVYPINMNFEHKKLFPGNSGPPTGEMGTTMFWSEPNKIFEQTLLKMAAEARRGGLRRLHRRQLHRQQQRDLPARVHLTLRLPDDLHPAGGHDHADRPLPADLAHGDDPKLKVKSGFQVGVRIVMPPFPFDDDATFESFSKNAVIVFKKGTPEEVHIEDIKIVEGQWLVAGTSGVVADRRRPRPDDEAGPRAGLRARAEHPHPQHVLPRRHRRALGRGLGQAAQLGIPEVGDAALSSRAERGTASSPAPLKRGPSALRPRQRLGHRRAAAFSCASTTAIAAMLTMSATSTPRWRTWTGRFRPRRIGPIASAPARRQTSL